MTRTCAGRVARLFLALVLAGAAVHPALAADADAEPVGRQAQRANELVFFLHSQAHHLSTSGETARRLNEDAWIAADIVLAVTRDRMRLFAEYLLSPQEHEIERLQAGFEPVADTIVWFGRFHQPASAWNVEHHHGRYLQTAITRPSIELWEDESGVLPQHVTGVLVESRRPAGDMAGVQFAAAAGLGARIDSEGLDPLELHDPRLRGRRISWTGRIGFLPEYAGASAFGLLFASHRLPVVDAAATAALGATDVRQNVYGAYGTWQGDPWRVVAAGYDVHLELHGLGTTRSERFAAGYLQVERQFPRALTAYAREQFSWRAARSTYVAASHPDFELRRATAGLRWDFRPRHALTVEVGRGERLRGHQTEARVQWSAALP